MKTNLLLYLIALATSAALGQGTLVFDQQVHHSETPPNYGEGTTIQQLPTPMGEIFTPTLNSVGFIRMIFDDHNPSNGIGATLYINLRQTITGPVLSTTATVTLPDSFRGTADFIFPVPVPVTPGTRYFFEPIVQAGDPWNTLFLADTAYPGGTSVVGGNPAAVPMWFREGIIVPEPSSAAFVLIAGTALVYSRRHKRDLNVPPGITRPPA